MTATPTSSRVPSVAADIDVGGAAFEQHQHDGCTVIRMAGEVDAAAAATLRGMIADLPTARLVIDLSQVTVLDSVGVCVLVAAWRHAASAGGAVRLVRPYRSPLKALHDTRVDQLLPILDSVETALQLDRAASDGIWDDPAV